MPLYSLHGNGHTGALTNTVCKIHCITTEVKGGQDLGVLDINREKSRCSLSSEKGAMGGTEEKGRISHDLICEISDRRCKVLLLASPAPVEGVPTGEKACFPERMTKECLI